MIPHVQVLEATVKYACRETGGDQELYDVVLTSSDVDGDIRVYSDLEDDLKPYDKGETVNLAYTPNSPQEYHILDEPEGGVDLSRQIDLKNGLYMEIYRRLPASLPEISRRKIATTIFIDQRKRGPIDESQFAEIE